MNTKEILQKLQTLFQPKVEETQLSEIEVQSEEIKEEVVEQVELAEAPKDEKEEVPMQEEAPAQAVEFATKLELEEMKRTFLELFAALQKEAESKQEVPKELSSDVEVELAENVEEISHSPELEVEKKFDLYKPKSNQSESIQSTIYKKLFN